MANNPRQGSVIKKLSVDNFEDLRKWLWSPEHHTLVIDGSQGQIEWSKNLLLELYGILQHPMRTLNEGKRNTAVISHMFSPVTGRGNEQQTIMIRDLVAQLIEAHRETLIDNYHVCDPTNHSVTPPKEPMNEPHALWSLFVDCIYHAKMAELIILLDQVNYMHLSCSETEFINFVENIDTFCQILRGNGVKVKVLVISLHSKAVGYFKRVKGRIIMNLLASLPKYHQAKFIYIYVVRTV